MKSTVLLVCLTAAVSLLATAESKSDEQSTETASPKPDASDKFIGTKAGQVPEDWEYTLPTDAQWEFTCRAGTTSTFSFGDDESKLGEYACFCGNVGKAGQHYAHQLGQKKPNPWGLYDMHGNVCEWCRGWYYEKMPGGRDPEEKTRTNQYQCRVIRGGSWNSIGKACHSAKWWGSEQRSRESEVGFRVALSPSGNK